MPAEELAGTCSGAFWFLIMWSYTPQWFSNAYSLGVTVGVTLTDIGGGGGGGGGCGGFSTALKLLLLSINLAASATAASLQKQYSSQSYCSPNNEQLLSTWQSPRCF